MGLKKPDCQLTKLLASMPLWDDKDFDTDFPNIKAFLCDSTYIGGATRIPGTIVAYSKGGALTLAINDNDNKRTAYINAASWAEAWAMAEMAICADDTDWKVKRVGQVGQTPPY